MDILKMFYSNVFTLQDWLHCIDTQGTLKPSLVQENDSKSFKELLSSVFVGVQDSGFHCRASSFSQHNNQKDNVMRVIERILRKKGTGKNLLTFGYCLMSDDPYAQTCGNNVENRYPNTCVTRLLYKSWDTLLSRVGDEVMMYLLEHTALFLDVSDSCFVQLSGTPVYNLWPYPGTVTLNHIGKSCSQDVRANTAKSFKPYDHCLSLPITSILFTHNVRERIPKSATISKLEPSFEGIQHLYQDVFVDTKILMSDYPPHVVIPTATEIESILKEPLLEVQNNTDAFGMQNHAVLERAANPALHEHHNSKLCGNGLGGQVSHVMYETGNIISGFTNINFEISGENLQNQNLACMGHGMHANKSNSDRNSQALQIDSHRNERKMTSFVDNTLINDSQLDSEQFIAVKLPMTGKAYCFCALCLRNSTGSFGSVEKHDCNDRSIENNHSISVDNGVFDMGDQGRLQEETVHNYAGNTTSTQINSFQDAALAPGYFKKDVGLSNKEILLARRKASLLQTKTSGVISHYVNTSCTFDNQSADIKMNWLKDQSADVEKCILQDLSTCIKNDTLQDRFAGIEKDMLDDHLVDIVKDTCENQSAFIGEIMLVNKSAGIEMDMLDNKSAGIEKDMLMNQPQGVAKKTLDHQPVVIGESISEDQHDSIEMDILEDKSSSIENILMKQSVFFEKDTIEDQSFGIGESKLENQSAGMVMDVLEDWSAGMETIALDNQSVCRLNQNDMLGGNSLVNKCETSACKPHINVNRFGKLFLHLESMNGRSPVNDVHVHEKHIVEQHTHSIQSQTYSEQHQSNNCNLVHASRHGLSQSKKPIEIDIHKTTTEMTSCETSDDTFKSARAQVDSHVCEVVVNHAAYVQDNTRSITINENITCSNKEIPVPTKLIPLLKELIHRHSKCPYKALLNHYCPILPNMDIGTVKQRKNGKQGMLLNRQSVSMTTLLNSHHHHRKVYLFVRACVLKTLPLTIVGSIRNRNVLLKNISLLISLGKYDKLSLGHVMCRMKTSDIDWLSGLCCNIVKLHMLAKLVYWLFSHYILVLLKTYFYITDTSILRYRLLYYRQAAWNRLHLQGMEDLLKRKILKPISETLVRSLIDRKSSMGVSTLRFVPKQKSLRAIFNMGRVAKQIPNQKLSVNQQLQDLHQILTCLKNRNPDLIGHGKMGTNDIYLSWNKYVQKWRSLGKPELFFVKTDIANCYFSMQQKKLYDIMETLLNQEMDFEEFIVRKYFTIKSCKQMVQRKFYRNVTPLLEFCTDYVSFCRTLVKQHHLHDVIFSDKVQYQHETVATLLRLLKAHLFNNIIQVDTRYYLQTEGISQGSVISTLLCSFYYTAMERDKFSVGDEDFLLRIVDDYLYVTPSLDNAMKFLNIMLQGIPEYNCITNRQKILTNFIYEKDPCPTITTDWFPWCGMLFNTKTLAVSVDYSRYIGSSIADTMTFDLSKPPGKAMRDKLLFSVRQKCHKILIDEDINSLPQVFKNLYEMFILCAFKFHAFARKLPFKRRVDDNPVYFFGIIKEIAKVVSRQLQQHKPSEVQATLQNEVSWLCVKAFYEKLCLHQTYRQLVKHLFNHLKFCHQNIMASQAIILHNIIGNNVTGMVSQMIS